MCKKLFSSGSICVRYLQDFQHLRIPLKPAATFFMFGFIHKTMNGRINRKAQ